jgi:threonine synthase
MKYYSTKNKLHVVGFEEAVMNGLAPDGGLYMPKSIPHLSKDFITNLEEKTFQEIAIEVLGYFTEESLGESKLMEIVGNTFNFPAPLIKLDECNFVLELFHGPTLAFKDFGARFMARTMEHFVQNSEKELNILVATSGDTGSAVANGFYNVDGINVYILYPSGGVSTIQEKQLTTLDKNITALEIEGTFDDCQKLVKQAFVDNELKEKLNLSSANSINIARLIPQAIYYFEAYKQLTDKKAKIIFSIPSGNLGNICAGLFAFKMGLPVNKFIGATNSNDVFTKYIDTGKFKPTESHKTYSNAMDVGNPSNLDRINHLYQNDINLIRSDIFSISKHDKATIDGMKKVREKYKYIIDPHGSIAYLSAEEYMKHQDYKTQSIILETAHPAKFKDIVEESLDIEIEIPNRLKQCLNKEKSVVKLSDRYTELKEFLLSK